MIAPLYRLPVGSINIANLKRKNTPWYTKLILLWRKGESSPFIRKENRDVPDNAIGTLADTMRKFLDEINKK